MNWWRSSRPTARSATGACWRSTAIVPWCSCLRASQGLKISESKARFLGHGMELAVSPDILGRVFDGIGRPKDGGPAIIPEKRMDINGTPINPLRAITRMSSSRRAFRHRRAEHLVRGQKLPVFSVRACPCTPGRADRPPGQGAGQRIQICRGLCGDRHHV